tara:strand:+ start:836 stop:1315 length:480 start_codon:yes stop_codon:yes gene_type:complete
MFTITLLLSSCDTNTPERNIGFVTGDNSELQWHLGTQEAIDVVTTVDSLWKNQDYEGMREFFADSVKVLRPNGTYTNSFDSFIESLSDGSNVTWSYDYAFSVDLDPEVGGEHVQAGFSVTYPGTNDSDERIDYQHESYYIVDGKIITLNQYYIRNVQQD